MTHDASTAETTAPVVRWAGPTGLGKVPAAAAVATLALLVPVLVIGGAKAAGALAQGPSAPAVSVADGAAGTLLDVPGSWVPQDPQSASGVEPADGAQEGAPVEQEAPAPSDTVYFIEDGDTLTDLSARFEMSVDYLADYNAVRDVDVISEGAVLRVPYIYIPPAG